MKTFKDNKNREWLIDVNVGSVKRVRSLLNVNLLDVVDGELLKKLGADTVLLVDVIFALCKTQADERSVTDEDFGAAMRGDAIDAATVAFMEDLVDFFPDARRKVLRTVLEKTRAMEQRVGREIDRRLNSPELNELMESELGKLFGSSPASSASTPTP